MTETTTIGIPVVLSIPHQRIADLVTTSLETPAQGWLIKAVPSQSFRQVASGIGGRPWYAVAATYESSSFQMLVTVENPVNDGRGDTIEKCLTMLDFQRALILMAKPDYVRHFADFISENDDANTADLFMQFAVYGEEVYA